MSKFRDTLTRIRSTTKGKMGGTLSDKARNELSKLRKSAATMGIVVFLVTLIGFVIAAYFTMYYVNDPEKIGLASGAMGLSLGAAIELLRRTWKEWTEANLTLILIDDAREDQVEAIFDRLIAKI